MKKVGLKSGRLIWLCLGTLFALAGVVMPVSASDNTCLDTREVSLTIDYKADLDGKIPVTDAEFTLFRIGTNETYSNGNEIGTRLCSLIESIEFSSETDTEELIKCCLESQALRQVEKIVGKTDSEGIFKAEHLKQGVYLVAETKSVDGYDPANSFLAVLPYVEKNEWVYDLTAQPKAIEKKELPVNTPVRTGDKSTINVRFMIFALLCSFMGCVFIRIILYKEGRD